MRLDRARIVNFRSISDITIRFEPRCRILVGINEAGKTNILHALSLLNPSSSAKPTDIREPRTDEPYDQDAFVRFVFVLEPEEKSEVLSSIQPKVLSSQADRSLLLAGQKPLSLAEFAEQRTEVIYQLNLRDNRRNFTTWKLPTHYRISPGWMKPSPSCPPDAAVSLQDGKSEPISALALLYAPDFPDLPNGHLVDAVVEDVSRALDAALIAAASSNLPPCVFWAYKEQNLLPSQIARATFTANPDSCMPLKYMFQLAGIDDIATAIAEAVTRPHGLRNLLNRVAVISTKHMHSVWKEYKGISIKLSPNGDNIDAAIQDRYNLYDMSRRSDGFKRFITFLLHISSQVRSDELNNKLYLHDEPDTSLHPSGARHLRDELIRISEKNYVAYSTHSIFMVDKELIRRHLIVSKTDEITTITEASESDVIDEEVIFTALGYSIFENLMKGNIIFEGWRDKQLFVIATSRWPADYKHLRDKYKNIGKCFARGVKDIQRLTSLLELGQRQYVIVSDCDRPAREHKAVFRGDGRWFLYEELVPGKGIVTAEDFIDPKAFFKSMTELAQEKPTLAPVTVQTLQSTNGRIAAICAWLSKSGLQGDEAKAALERIKESVFSNLKRSHITKLYYDALSSLYQYVATSA